MFVELINIFPVSFYLTPNSIDYIIARLTHILNNIFYFWKMQEKHRQNKWKQVFPNQDSSIPSPRWGHASLVIEKEFVIYGGYADTIYKNDIWSYDAELKEWKEVKTWGKAPQNRSNCSMNYDEKNNRLVVFGGGGSNKRKFNSIYTLDWKTKEWKEIMPKSNKIPEQRTYHSSEFVYPYLVVFGGQALVDLDDMWVFNFESQQWEEIEIEKNLPKPLGRRFHSSLLVNDEMIIIGGCFARYRSLNDIWTINLSSLRENKLTGLQWKEKKLDGSAFLTRWGHSSSYYKNKIYVFGGRFSSDLNDLLMIDLEAGTIKVVNKAIVNAPSPRRRHSSAFMGSSLLVFGGFNSQYYNDLYFLTLSDQLPNVDKSTIVEKLALEIDNPRFIDTKIIVQDSELFEVNKQILFSNALYGDKQKQMKFFKFLSSLPLAEAKLYLKQAYCKASIPASLEEASNLRQFLNQKADYKQYLKNVQLNLRPKKSKQMFEIPQATRNFGVCRIVDQEWESILKNSDGDVTFKIANKSQIKCKKSLLSLNSTYFKHMLSDYFCKQKNPVIEINNCNENVFKVMIKFFEYDILFVPVSFEQQDWIELTLLSKYYFSKRLLQICEYQLISMISSEDTSDLLKFSVQNNLKHLESYCIEELVRHQCQFFAIDGVFLRYDHYQPSLEESKIDKKIAELKKQKHRNLFFDIQQNITNDLVLLPRGFQHKSSMQKLGSRKESMLGSGKENAVPRRISRQL